MKFDISRQNARMELRIMELEDSVAAMTKIIGTMTDMLAGLNRIAAHYADTVQAMLPLPAVSQLRAPAVIMTGDNGAGSCRGDCPCAAADDEEEQRPE